MGRSDRMVRRVYEAIDERYEGNVHLVELPAKAGDRRHSAADVLDAIAPTLPITIAPAAVVIPGADRREVVRPVSSLKHRSPRCRWLPPAGQCPRAAGEN
jgi:hypothetical protein